MEIKDFEIHDTSDALTGRFMSFGLCPNTECNAIHVMIFDENMKMICQCKINMEFASAIRQQIGDMVELRSAKIAGPN